MIIIGLDGATWKIIMKNIEDLKTIKSLMDRGYHGTIYLKYKPLSPAIWTSMFSGISPRIHNHWDFIKNNSLVKRDDIPVKFIWEILYEKGYDVYVLNVPFIIPPYNFRVEFKPIGYGLPITEKECLDEINLITNKALEIIEKKPDLFIFVYTALDRYSHLHWGEKKLLDFYILIDKALSKIFNNYDGDYIIVSDHGFTDLNKARYKTLKRYDNIKGEHDIDAIYISNMNLNIQQPEDIFYIIKRYFHV